MCQSLFFNKETATLLKKETLAQVFSCELYEISIKTFFTEHLPTDASVLPKSISFVTLYELFKHLL